MFDIISWLSSPSNSWVTVRLFVRPSLWGLCSARRAAGGSPVTYSDRELKTMLYFMRDVFFTSKQKCKREHEILFFSSSNN